MSTENILVVHQKEIETQGRTIHVKDYITKDYVFTKADKKEIIYLKNKCKLYTVDHENKFLKPVDITAQKAQMEQAQTMLPNTSVVFEDVDGKHRRSTIEGRNITAIVKSVSLLKTIPELVKTCYYDSYQFSQQAVIVPLEINAIELITEMDFTINFQGNINKTVIKNSEVEIVKDSALKDTYDAICNYTVEEEFSIAN